MSTTDGIAGKSGCEWYHPTHCSPSASIREQTLTWSSESISTLILSKRRFARNETGWCQVRREIPFLKWFRGRLHSPVVISLDLVHRVGTFHTDVMPLLIMAPAKQPNHLTGVKVPVEVHNKLSPGVWNGTPGSPVELPRAGNRRRRHHARTLQ